MVQLLLMIAAALVASAAAYKSLSTQIISKTALNSVKMILTVEEPIENSLRRFKRSVNQSGHLMELRHRELWETAADKRKRKAERARQLNRIERTNDRYERRSDGSPEYSS